MDRSTKILIIVVIVIALLFVVAMLWGVGKHRNEHTDPKNFQTPGWVKNGLGKLFGSAIPKLEVDPRKFAISPGQSFGPITIKAVQEDGPQFRKAKFRLTAGRATITYIDVTPDRPTELSDTQKVAFPAPSDEAARKDKPNEGLITAMRGGGKLTIHCEGPVPCALEVE